MDRNGINSGVSNGINSGVSNGINHGIDQGINGGIEEMIGRINALYHKSQAEGLTEEEKAEQAKLRKAYVANVRNNLKSQLDQISIVEKDGTVTNLGEKHNRTDIPKK